MKRVVILILSLASIGLLARVAPAAQARQAALPWRHDPHTLILVTEGSAADLDPASDELASSDMIARNIGQTLVALHGASTTRLDGVLATSWKSKQGGKVYIFHLRHGVRFHTGRLLTSADVVYSLQRTMLAGLTNSYLLGRFISHPRDQIKALDRYTVQFTLDRPSGFLPAALADSYSMTIVDAKALKQHEKNHDWGHSWAQSADIGTGPYHIQSWQHSQQIVLTRFPQYWGGWKGSHFSRIIVRTVPESTTRRELTERGDADLTFDLTPQDYVAMSREPGIRVIARYGTAIQYVVMTEYGPLASPAARQALSYAFNYDALINGFYKGYARRAYGPIASTVLGFDPHHFTYQTDLNRAKQLLERAGVKPGTVLTYDYYPGTISAGQGEILQAQLGQLGITVKLKELDEATFNGIFYGSEPASKRPNLMPFEWWPDYNDPYDDVNVILNSAMAGAQGANAGFYHNAQVDALLHQMNNAGLPTLLTDTRRLQDLTTRQDPPAIWTTEPADVTVLRSWVKGFVFNPLLIQTYDFYGLHP